MTGDCAPFYQIYSTVQFSRFCLRLCSYRKIPHLFFASFNRVTHKQILRNYDRKIGNLFQGHSAAKIVIVSDEEVSSFSRIKLLYMI